VTRVFDNWLTAVLPDPVTIGRVRLHPLSYGHAFLLARITGWEPLGTAFPPEDIPVGLHVCSRPWKQAMQELGTWRARRFIRKLAKSASLVEVVKTWRDYLETALVLPGIRKVKSKLETEAKTPSQAPLLLRLRLFAMAEFGMSEEALGDAIFADLVWLWLMRGEEAGSIRLEGDADLQFEEWIRAQELAKHNPS